jgi:hypothetical protein
MISLNNFTTIEDAEQLLNKINAASTNCDLLLPAQLKRWSWGAMGTLIQVIITWAKRNPEGRLLTHILQPGQSTHYFENCVRWDHGLVSLLMASKVTDRNCKRIFESEPLLHVESRLEDMARGKKIPGMGPERTFICADHLPPLGLLPQFYHHVEHQTERLKEEEDFIILAHESIGELIRRYRTNIPVDDTVEEQVGTILYEIFTNTHFWAREDEIGNDIGKSVRGIRMELLAGTRRNPIVGEGLAIPIKHYLRSKPSDSLFGGRFLEISIFDSGPGLFQRWIGRQSTSQDQLADEYKAVMKCLAKHSSKSKRSIHGVGLHLVMKTLTNTRGFLRLRTGRLALFRDFSKPRAGDDTNEPYLLDWASQSTALTRFGSIEGTLLTMIIPIHEETVRTYV